MYESTYEPQWNFGHSKKRIPLNKGQVVVLTVIIHLLRTYSTSEKRTQPALQYLRISLSGTSGIT